MVRSAPFTYLLVLVLFSVTLFTLVSLLDGLNSTFFFYLQLGFDV